MKSLPALLLFFGVQTVFSQAIFSHSHEDREFSFPNVPGYQTLSCDFHMHTVFSDGSVWPDIRVQEAEKDGLDAISLTEHLEYQPHSSDIPHPDRNRAHEVALNAAEGTELLIIRGSEITRSMPPGHSNAIFIQDANKLLIEDSVKVFEEAKRQGAFVFWNHPNWRAQAKDGIARLTDVHKHLIENDLLHGIEVVNDLTYSEEALQIAYDNDLTVIGTSDIHGLVDWQYHIPHGGHRPITLVHAKERTGESIKEALFEGRTTVLFNHTFIGKAEYLVPLLRSSLTVTQASYIDNFTIAQIQVENSSSEDIILENSSELNFYRNVDLVTVPAKSSLILEVKTLEKVKQFSLSFTVLNAIIAPDTHPSITFDIIVK